MNETIIDQLIAGLRYSGEGHNLIMTGLKIFQNREPYRQ